MVLPSSDDESRPLVIGIAADVTLRHLWDLPELKLHNKTPQRESALQRLKVLLRPALTRFAPLQAELAQFTTSHEVSATSVAVERLVVPALFQVRTLTDRSMDVSLVLFPRGLSGTVLDLKRLIQTSWGFPILQQRLVYTPHSTRLGSVLNADENSIASYGVRRGAVIYIVLRSRGPDGRFLARFNRGELRIRYESLEAFHDRHQELEVANALLAAFIDDLGGARLEVSSPQPLLVCHNLHERRDVTRAVTVWSKEELLGLLSVRRVRKKWDRAFSLIQEWVAIPPESWANTHVPVPGRTLKRRDVDGSVSLQFQSNVFTAVAQLRTCLHLSGELLGVVKERTTDGRVIACCRLHHCMHKSLTNDWNGALLREGEVLSVDVLF
jgi:hypothetical protein